MSSSLFAEPAFYMIILLAIVGFSLLPVGHNLIDSGMNSLTCEGLLKMKSNLHDKPFFNTDTMNEMIDQKDCLDIKFTERQSKR